MEPCSTCFKKNMLCTGPVNRRCLNCKDSHSRCTKSTWARKNTQRCAEKRSYPALRSNSRRKQPRACTQALLTSRLRPSTSPSSQAALSSPSHSGEFAGTESNLAPSPPPLLDDYASDDVAMSGLCFDAPAPERPIMDPCHDMDRHEWFSHTSCEVACGGTHAWEGVTEGLYAGLELFSRQLAYAIGVHSNMVATLREAQELIDERGYPRFLFL